MVAVIWARYYDDATPPYIELGTRTGIRTSKNQRSVIRIPWVVDYRNVKGAWPHLGKCTNGIPEAEVGRDRHKATGRVSI